MSRHLHRAPSGPPKARDRGAILSGLLAFVGWLQRHPERDHSGEMLSIGQRTEAEPF